MGEPLRPLTGFWRSVARRAFPEPPRSAELLYRFEQKWSPVPPRVSKGDGPLLAVIVPTLAPAEGEGSAASCLRGLAETIDDLMRTAARPRVMVIVAAQDRPGHARRESVLAELESLWAGLPQAMRIPWVGLSVSIASKVLAIDSTIPLLDANGAAAVAWFDDDIEILPDCLAALWGAFDPAFGGIYGARKVAIRDATVFSGWWAESKNRRESVNLYPHGCAMLMSRAVFGEGIPVEYITDDHFYLFRYLAPEASDPLRDLRVVAKAEVRVPMVNSALVAVGRFARNYRNLQRVLADVPDATRRCFLRRLHLPGLRAPGSLREALSGRFWLRFLFHAGKAVYWYGLRAEILLRGLLYRPRKTVWYSAAPPAALRGR